MMKMETSASMIRLEIWCLKMRMEMEMLSSGWMKEKEIRQWVSP